VQRQTLIVPAAADALARLPVGGGPSGLPIAPASGLLVTAECLVCADVHAIAPGASIPHRCPSCNRAEW
jgi:hypothetical protein